MNYFEGDHIPPPHPLFTPKMVKISWSYLVVWWLRIVKVLFRFFLLDCMVLCQTSENDKNCLCSEMEKLWMHAFADFCFSYFVSGCFMDLTSCLERDWSSAVDDDYRLIKESVSWLTPNVEKLTVFKTSISRCLLSFPSQSLLKTTLNCAVNMEGKGVRPSSISLQGLCVCFCVLYLVICQDSFSTVVIIRGLISVILFLET